MRIVVRVLVLVLVVMLLLLLRRLMMGGLRLANAGRGDCEAIVFELLVILRPLLFILAPPAEVEKGQHSKCAYNNNSSVSSVLASSTCHLSE